MKTKRGKIMYRNPFLVSLAFVIMASCSTLAGDRTLVTGAGRDDLLKLRSGPGLGYSVVLGLPDGTPLRRGSCVTEVGQRWCQVSLAGAPRISGYVSADYLAAR
jgi:uncharacterized protein YraI